MTEALLWDQNKESMNNLMLQNKKIKVESFDQCPKYEM